MKVMFAWNSHKVQHLAEKETTLRQTKKAKWITDPLYGYVLLLLVVLNSITSANQVSHPEGIMQPSKWILHFPSLVKAPDEYCESNPYCIRLRRDL